MDNRQRIIYLLDRYTSNECTNEELAELFDQLSAEEHDEIFEAHIEGKLLSSFVPGADLAAYQSEAIVRKVFSTTETHTAIIRRMSMRKRIQRWVVAAVIAGIVVLSAVMIVTQQSAKTLSPSVASLRVNSKRFINTSDKAVLISLEDGSRVTLQPNASLTYPMIFTADEREVLLEGDAFFDIARNPAKPFLVYHGALITRVLGTSFYIRQDSNREQASVEVTHGKVEVYENDQFRKNVTRDNGVIITPNQKVTYTESGHQFNTSLVEHPIQLPISDPLKNSPAAVANRFNFESASLSTITEVLTKNYGIEIELESEQLGNCSFTGDVSEQGLYEKLDLICRAVGASYEIKNTRILIKGKGCTKNE
ncbi:MAG: hypothetical protein DI535_04830 [Citrobacter freundii]|nr:MAG: hypothetical protein DI535_04830 [Citrobacter freundii]